MAGPVQGMTLNRLDLHPSSERPGAQVAVRRGVNALSPIDPKRRLAAARLSVQPASQRSGKGVPELVARGFVSDEGTADVLAEGARVVANTIEACSVEERGDPGLMKERIRVELRRFLKKRTWRRPMDLPVVMEI